MEKSTSVRFKLRVQHDMLLTLMEEVGLNQTSFAKALGVAQTTVSHWVNLHQVPTMKFRDKIEEVLHCTFDLLYPDWFVAKIQQGLVTKYEVSKLVTAKSFDSMIIRELQGAQDPARLTEKAEIQELVYESLDCLTPKMRRILEMRYGFDEKPMTYREIAERFCVSTGRIRQIISSAEARLASHMKRGIGPLSKLRR